jgi:dTDP-4-dehydrorhamnose reductase
MIDNLVDIVMKLYLKNANGIFNVVGNNRVSKLEFGIEVAKIFGLNLNLISAGSIIENNKLVKRPKDLSLSNAKVKSFLKVEIINLSEQIAELRNREFDKFSKLSSIVL